MVVTPSLNYVLSSVKTMISSSWNNVRDSAKEEIRKLRNFRSK